MEWITNLSKVKDKKETFILEIGESFDILNCPILTGVTMNYEGLEIRTQIIAIFQA